MRALGYAVGGGILGGVVGYVVFIYSAVLGLIGNAPDIEGLYDVILDMFVFPFLGLIFGALGGLAVERRSRERRPKSAFPPPRSRVK